MNLSKRKPSILCSGTSVLLLVMAATCSSSTTPSTVNVRPHDADNAPGETRYCKYTIVDVTGTGTHQVGDNLCVVCGSDLCPTERVIIPSEGIEYSVKIESLVTCVTCNGVDLDKFYEDL